jgi:hypothetical protein
VILQPIDYEAEEALNQYVLRYILHASVLMFSSRERLAAKSPGLRPEYATEAAPRLAAAKPKRRKHYHIPAVEPLTKAVVVPQTREPSAPTPAPLQRSAIKFGVGKASSSTVRDYRSDAICRVQRSKRSQQRGARPSHPRTSASSSILRSTATTFFATHIANLVAGRTFG